MRNVLASFAKCTAMQIADCFSKCSPVSVIPATRSTNTTSWRYVNDSELRRVPQGATPWRDQINNRTRCRCHAACWLERHKKFWWQGRFGGYPPPEVREPRRKA